MTTMRKIIIILCLIGILSLWINFSQVSLNRPPTYKETSKYISNPFRSSISVISNQDTMIFNKAEQQQQNKQKQKQQDELVNKTLFLQELERTAYYSDSYRTYNCSNKMEKSGSKPSFLIAGVHKGGSTALYNYLARHGHVRPAVCKEVNYFGVNETYAKGMKFYLKHFRNVDKWKGHVVVGEGTPNYIRRPYVPQRVKKYLPNVVIIVVVRNPVDRFISHWVGIQKRNATTLTCDEYFLHDLIQQYKCEKQHHIELSYVEKIFNATINENLVKSLNDLDEDFDKTGTQLKFIHNKQSTAHSVKFDQRSLAVIRKCMVLNHESAVSRGVYQFQIENWLEYFSPKQILLIQSEYMFKNVVSVMQDVALALGIRQYQPNELSKLAKSGQGSHHINSGPASTCSRHAIERYYSHFNSQFKDFLTENHPKTLTQWEQGWIGME